MTTTTTDLARWVMDGPYGGRKYNWQQCRYCGRAREYDCAPATCLLCGTRLCHGAGSTCGVCHYGWIPGWSRGSYGDSQDCGYKGCEQPAVAKAPRVKRVCRDHVDRVKIRHAGRDITLPDYVAAQLAHRDSGKGWERWRYIDL